MSELADRLAREACRKVHVNPESELAYAIAMEAARAALDEAVRVARKHTHIASPGPCDCTANIVAAIEALAR